MKAGLESLGRYVAKEVGPDKIRVNMLSAGPIRTVAAKSVPVFHNSRTRGARRRRWAGTCMTRAPSPTPPSRCCRPSFGHDRVDHLRRRRLPLDGLILLVGELRLVEDAVDATFGQELRVTATLNDGAVLDDEYLIGVSNRRQSVRDHQ